MTNGGSPKYNDKALVRRIIAELRPIDDERGETKMSAVVDRILSEMKDEWLNEGIAKGRTQGITEGRMQGITEGRMQGITEGITKGKKETARKMLAAGTFSSEQVAEYSGLSIEEVKKIKASLT